MPSDQQRMYDHASNLVMLLALNIPEEQVISKIGEIVVCGLSLSLCLYHSLRIYSEMQLTECGGP